MSMGRGGTDLIPRLRGSCVADASFSSGSCAAGPALTVMANAFRAADPPQERLR